MEKRRHTPYTDTTFNHIEFAEITFAFHSKTIITQL